MKKISLGSLFVLLVVLTLCPGAHAALLYEQATLETSDRGAYQYVDQQLADDFVPLVSGTLTTITWKGSYYDSDNPSAAESFTVQVFADNAGLPPATPLFEVVGPASKVASGTLQSKTLYEYSMSVSGPILTAGTTYWINIYSNESPQNYAWADSTDGTSAGAIRYAPLDPWGGFNGYERSNHIFALHGGPAACTPPPSGMVSWWGGDNNALDSAGNNDGTLVNNITYAPGMVGRAFSLDGNGDYVSVPDSPSLDITSQVTLDAWIYPTALGGRIVNKITAGGGDGYLLDTYGGVARFIVGNQGLNGATALPLNTWTHVAGTYNGTTMTVYVNGAFDSSRAVSISIPANNLPLRIGADSNGASPFSGLIDEVEVFNRALSASEIAAISNAGSAGKCRSCLTPPSNMVSWWDGEGNADDIIGTNSGTLQNGTSFSPGKVGQAFSLDGTNDYVTVPSSPDLNFGSNPFTISTWIKTSQTGSWKRIVAKRDPTGGGYWYSLVINDSRARLELCAGCNLDSGSIVNDGEWHLIVVTRDRTANMFNMYIDGILENTRTDNGFAFDNGIGSPLEIGKWASESYGGTYAGLIDEVQIFNRALTADEIAAIYNAGSAGQCTQQEEQHTLTVTRAGTGAGTVTASGITCGTDCSESLDEGTVVTLTATPATGSIFTGWSGDPDCFDGRVTMNADKTCTATFKLAPDLVGSWTWTRKSGPDRRGNYKFSGSLNVSNIGPASANNAVVNVYLSDNSTYEPGDTLIASLSYGTIGTKITKGKSFNLTTRKNPTGKYVIGVIDPSNIVTESNEANNSALKLVP